MRDLAITYSIYGNFDTNRLIASIRSVFGQRGPAPQIIVSEENLESKMDGLDKEFPLIHIFSKPEQDSEGNCIFNPGKIRNRALAKVNSEFIYLNDADIVFMNPDYFLELSREIKTDEALIRAPSRRLIRKDVEEFIKLIEKKGIDEALSHLKYPNEYVANLDGVEHELKVVTHRNGRLYTTEISTFYRYLIDESMKGKEPTFWHDVVHVGSIFTRTDMVKSVGGYTESYITWGYEDVDLQWKLGETYSTRKIPRVRKFEVLHLDHPKRYFSQECNDRNRQAFETRQSEGVRKAIQRDLDRTR